MKKIIFLYHVKAREYSIIEMISEQIRRKYKNVLIKSGEIYSSIMDTIQFRPDIIVSIPPRDYHASNYLTMLKIITGAVVISMSTEGFYILSSPKLILDITGFNKYSKELIDYYLMWGPKTRIRLGQQLLIDDKLSNMRRVKVTGYAFYECDKLHKKYESYNNDDLTSWFTKYPQKILIITGFVIADCSIEEYHALGYFQNEKTLKQMSSQEIAQAKESIDAEIEFRKKYIDGILALALNNPQMGIVVKLHPIEIELKSKIYDSLQICPNILLIKGQIPVGFFLEKVDGMIHYNSTCNLEAYIYKVPTIQIFNDNQTSYKHIWQYKGDSTYLVHIDNFQEINNIVKEGMKYRRLQSIEKTLFDLFNWKLDREYRPVEKAADYILNSKKAQRLKYHDKEVINAIYSAEGRKVMDMLMDNLWRKISNNEMAIKEIIAIFKIYKQIFLNKICTLVFLKYKKVR